MRLRTLKIEAEGPNGWASNELVFGREITELFGPNGCGKTPVIHSIAYCLGYPVKYRDDLLSKCSAAVLTLESEGSVVELRRKIGSQFDVEVRAGENFRGYYSEKEYSAYLLDLFGFGVPTLTSAAGDATTPYMATLLPLFFLDQDHGYTSQYHAQNNFIRDQYAEMMRLVFGLPPKNSFDQKKLVLQKKQRVEQLDRAIVKRREMIAELTEDLGKVRRDLAIVDAEIAALQGQLQRLKDSKSLKTDAESALDELIYGKTSERRKLVSESNELQVRINGFDRIRNEIEVEVNTLSLNEEARRLFSSFEDICANPQCGLFLGSSESYGKNLLYLRDQLKDLNRNTEGQRARVASLVQQVDAVTVEIQGLEERRAEISEGSESAALVQAISDLTRRVYELQREREGLTEITLNEKEYIAFMNERELVQNDLASLGGTSGAVDLRAIEIRANWRAGIRRWLDVLNTPNISKEIELEGDWGLKFGEEKIGQFKGSTLLRVVLAIHTAMFELHVMDKSKKFRFLILDTPRQQDIDRETMGAYIEALKKLAAEHAAQVVFSTTDYHYQGREGDREWLPTFPGPEQMMFLGPPVAPLGLPPPLGT